MMGHRAYRRGGGEWLGRGGIRRGGNGGIKMGTVGRCIGRSVDKLRGSGAAGDLEWGQERRRRTL